MALNDIGLCARALARVGVHPITSFADGTAESEIAALLYPPLRDAILSSYPWSFATAKISLTRLETAPVADYAYAYQLPSGFLRALSAGMGTRGRGVSYRLVQNQLHSDASAITLTYLYRPEEEDFPPYFAAAVITRLAAEFCLPLTENTARAEALARLADQDLIRARQIDAQQHSPNRIERFPLIDARE